MEQSNEVLRYAVSRTPEFKAQVDASLARAGVELTQEDELLCCEHTVAGKSYAKSYFIAAEDVFAAAERSTARECPAKDYCDAILALNESELGAMTLFIVGDAQYVYASKNRCVFKSLEVDMQRMKKCVVSFEWLPRVVANPFNELAAGRRITGPIKFKAYVKDYFDEHAIPGAPVQGTMVAVNAQAAAVAALKEPAKIASPARTEMRRCIEAVFTRIAGTDERILWEDDGVYQTDFDEFYYTPAQVMGGGYQVALDLAIALAQCAANYPNDGVIKLDYRWSSLDRARRFAAMNVLRDFMAATGLSVLVPVYQDDTVELANYAMSTIL